MQKIIYNSFFLLMMCLVLSCGDGVSSSGEDVSGVSTESSTVEVDSSSSSLEENISSSSVQESSSSKIQGDKSSSSEEDVSSSSLEENISSSSIQESSSSKIQGDKSSSSEEDVSSSSLKENISSSSIQESSSSKIQGDKSSSSEEDVSSSSLQENISSSSKGTSSSSSLVVGKCKTTTKDNCVYGELYDKRDGKTYKTVVMGTQEWMAENLNYSDSNYTPNLQGGSWCYNNDTLNCAKYGRLYQWAAAIDTLESDCGYMEEGCADLDVKNRQGICPSGWHLPDTSELSELIAYVKKYSPKNYWKDLLATSEPNGTDAFGFSLLYAGSYSNWNASSPNYLTLGSMTYLWSSMPKSEYESYTAIFKQNDGYVYVDDTYKATGLSVRCIKNSAVSKSIH